jgi:hypothetical protein
MTNQLAGPAQGPMWSFRGNSPEGDGSDGINLRRGCDTNARTPAEVDHHQHAPSVSHDLHDGPIDAV